VVGAEFRRFGGGRFGGRDETDKLRFCGIVDGGFGCGADAVLLCWLKLILKGEDES